MGLGCVRKNPWGVWFGVCVMVSLGACSDDSVDDVEGDNAASNGAVGASNMSTSNGGTTGEQDTTNGGGEEAPPLPEGWFNFLTDPFTVPSGTEQYYCFAMTLEEDLVIDRMEYYSEPVVHHFLFAKTLAPEPEGFSDCPVFFKTSWVPLFATGTSDASLQMPDGYAHRLKRGEQIMIQLHLLNTARTETEAQVSIRMRPAADPDAKPVGIYAFGTNNVVLPPNQETALVNECRIEDSRDIDIFAFFPHMHQLGKSIGLEVQNDAGEWESVFLDDNFIFDEQYIAPQELTLKDGDLTRVTCRYNNTGDEPVMFGDSSLDEMCYLVGFTTTREGLDGCIDLTTPDGSVSNNTTDPPPMGVCGEDPPNDLGIGAACTKEGGECAEGTFCSLDQGNTPDDAEGFCLSIGACQATADCGGGAAVCCAPAEGGGVINICVPDACRPSNCALQN